MNEWSVNKGKYLGFTGDENDAADLVIIGTFACVAHDKLKSRLQESPAETER